MSSEPSPFQRHLNNNIGTLHHLGALAAYKQAQSANEHARRVEGQNEELAATQAKIASIEEERLQMLKNQQRPPSKRILPFRSEERVGRYRIRCQSRR